MGFILFILLLIYLIIDRPFIKNNKTSSKKMFVAILLILGLIHGTYYWYLSEQLNSKIISGILLLVLFVAYLMSGDHHGIEDKVARKVFRIITWLIIWFLTLFHMLYT
ncbi:hypothetical protein BHF71_02760 [Vulcanibacillus modesticaldus]|uniref:Uncharacterized protein n=1 Tax=Vulcanibacillus modesticaldus TaxID=337097 RepID=A0A1D2YT67_9BACI|nr:hypothetical protein [Vulcanibacillus modesticaldus]OEF98865.1 hypothetical protein BHF71_02760 [Vulcanibacillus modesticaldus]